MIIINKYSIYLQILVENPKPPQKPPSEIVNQFIIMKYIFLYQLQK